jgi:hypothetical protein
MSDFVEQCRREWKRLQVPDPLAEEMAADLASDLREAEAEGVSAEELLGRSVFDPKTFAASWAAERGIIPAAPERRTRRRPLVLVAFTAVSALVVFVSALALATGQPQASIVATTRSHRPSAPAGFVPTTRHLVAQASLAAPVEWILLVLAILALGFAAWLWTSWNRSGPTRGLPA